MVELQANNIFRESLELLLRSHDYAGELSRSVWDFGVELKVLKSLGLFESDLRWLVCKGFVEHAQEVTPLGSCQRSFESTGPLTFTPRSCFILTEKGVRYACRIARRNGASEVSNETRELLVTRSEPHCKILQERITVARMQEPIDPKLEEEELAPYWDGVRRELRLGQQLVKQFRLPSPNQLYVLTTFQEEGWPPRIDDPLPPLPDTHPKQRLRETIRSLNRHQKSLLCVRFKGDGTGEGVLWEILAAYK
ncbi:MAG: hypothetical protein HYV60_24380 [Planctomycetia bacterium]|nr:hypothetical protein [Planctomycetia bacterium]